MGQKLNQMSKKQSKPSFFCGREEDVEEYYRNTFHNQQRRDCDQEIDLDCGYYHETIPLQDFFESEDVQEGDLCRPNRNNNRSLTNSNMYIQQHNFLDRPVYSDLSYYPHNNNNEEAKNDENYLIRRILSDQRYLDTNASQLGSLVYSENTKPVSICPTCRKIPHNCDSSSTTTPYMNYNTKSDYLPTFGSSCVNLGGTSSQDIIEVNNNNNNNNNNNESKQKKIMNDKVIPDDLQTYINNEVTNQLIKLISVNEERKRFEKNNEDANPALLFQEAINKAVQNLVKEGIVLDVLSGANVQVPAEILDRVGIPFIEKKKKDMMHSKETNRNMLTKKHDVEKLCMDDNKAENMQIDNESSFGKIRALNITCINVQSQMAINRQVYVSEVSSDAPVYIIPEFLIPEECEHLLQLVQNQWRNVDHLQAYGANEEVISRLRYSKLSFGTDNIADNILSRVGCALSCEDSALEPLNIVKFDPKLQIDGEHDGISRRKTLIVFLTDNFDGGEVDFPMLSLYIKPCVGTALMWSNVTQTGEEDYRTTKNWMPCQNGCRNVLYCFENSLLYKNRLPK